MAEIRCPKCGSRMIILTTTEDDFRHYVCSNRPTCTERIAVEEAWAYMSEEGRPSGMGDGGVRQSEKASQSRAGTAVGMLEQGGLWLKLIFQRSKHKVKAPVGEVRDNDKDRLGMMPQAAFREIEPVKMREVAHYQPEQPEALEKEAAGERKEPPKAWAEHSHGEVGVSETKTEIREEKRPARRWWSRVAGEEMAAESKDVPKTQQSGALSGEIPLKKEEPLTTQPRMAPKPGIAHEIKDLPTPRPRPLLVPEKALATKGKRRFRYWRRRAHEGEAANKGKELLRPAQQLTEASLAVPEIKEPDKSVVPMTPEVYEPERAEEGLSPQPPGGMQSDMDAGERKHFLIIILIAMAVACIVVIAGLIYSVFVLR